MKKNKQSNNIFSKSYLFTLVSFFVFVFSTQVAFASDAFVFLKSPAGVLIGRITYENTSTLNILKINAFCTYIYFAEGTSCEYVDANSPLTNNQGVLPVRDVGVGGSTNDNYRWVRGAISAVSTRLDGFIKAVTFYNPQIKEPTPIVVPLGTVTTNTSTNQPVQQQQIILSGQPTPNTQPISQPAPQPAPSAPQTKTTNPATTEPTTNSQPQIVYQVIERAVPGPQGPVGPQGPQGPAGAGGYYSAPSFPGTAQFNGYTSGNSGITTGSDASLNSITANTGNFSNITVTGSSTLNTVTANAATITSATITNLNVGAITFSGVNTLTGTITNSTSTNLYSTNASITNATTSNFFSALLTSLSGFFTNLIATNATFTNATATNLYVSGSISAPGLSGTSLSVTNATLTNSTSTNLNVSGTLTGGNIYTSASSTLGSTTVSNLTSTGNLAGQNINGTNANFVNATITNATTSKIATTDITATGTITSQNIRLADTGANGIFWKMYEDVSNNFNLDYGATNFLNYDYTGLLNIKSALRVTGSTTLASTSVTNETVTGTLAANILSAVNAIFTTLFTPTAYITTLNASTTNASTSNAITFNGTTANIQDIYASTTNASTTNSININATNATITNATITSATVTTINGQTITSTNFLGTSATFTNATVTGAISLASGLNSTATSTFSTTTAASSSVTNLNSTNLYATNATFTNSTTTNLNVSGTLTGGNIYTSASSTLGSTTVSNLTSSGNIGANTINATNFNGVDATITNATTSNFFSTILTALTSSFTNLFATNGTITNATSTNLNVSSLLTALSAVFTNLIATNATLTNATATNLAVANLNTTGTVTLGSTNGWLYGTNGVVNGSSSPTVGYITATSGTSTFLGMIVNGSIVPALDNTYDLGSPSSKFRSLYVSSSTIYIDNVPLSNNTGDLTWGGSGISAGKATFTSATTTNLYSQNFTQGLTNGYVIRGGTSNISEATSSLFIADNGRIGIGSTNPSANLTINQGTLTGLAQGALQIGGTWNNAGTIFKGIEVDITNTNSHSNSNLLNLAIGGSSIFRVSPTAGTIVTSNFGVTGTTTLNGAIDASSNRIQNVAYPTANTDAANKAYVDSFAQGVFYQTPVKTISTTTIVSSTTGDRYIVSVGSSGTGCSINQIAENTGVGIWTCSTPATGTSVYADMGLDQTYNFNGTSWVQLGSTISHQSLSNLQGGTAGEYYHLNSSQYGSLNSVNAQLDQLKTTGTATQFVNLTLTGGLNITGGGAGATITNATFTNVYVTNNASVTDLLATRATTSYLNAGTTTIGTATIATTTITTANIQNLWANLLSLASSVFAPFGYFTNLYATTTYATTSNATTFNGITGNFQNLYASTSYATTSFATTSYVTNLNVAGSSTLASTSVSNETVTGTLAATNMVVSTATVATENVQTLWANIATFATSIFSPLAYFTNLYATTTYATTSNAVTFNGTTGNFTNLYTQNLYASTTNATTTNTSGLTTTGNLAVTASSTLASTTLKDFTSNGNGAITGGLTVGSTTVSGIAALGNIFSTGSSTLGSTTLTNFTANTGAISNLISNAATLTSATITNLSISGAFSSALTNGFVFRGSTANLSEATSSLFLSNLGYIGLGTTTPTRRLSVTDTVSAPQMIMAYDSTRYVTQQVDTAGDYLLAPSGGNVRVNDGNVYVCSGGSCPSGSATGNGNLIVETKIGVGSSTPWAAISVNGGSIMSSEFSLTDGATITVDLKNGNQQKVTLGGNRTINFSNYLPGQLLRLVVCQDGTGSRTVTWDSSVLWPSATAPTLTTTANKCDVVSFFATGATSTTKIFGSSVLSF